GDRIRIEGGRGPSRMLETTPPCVNSVRRYGTAKIESVSCEHQSQVGRAIGAHGARMKLRPDGQCVLPTRTRSFGRSSAVKLDLLGLRIDCRMTFDFSGEMKFHPRVSVVRRLHELHFREIQ